jgi:protocatechuate 3,4-dioxygenase beta subunit
MKNPAPYRRPYFDTQPEYLFPQYASTVKRAPREPLVVLPHTLSEVTAPVFGYGDIKPTDNDLTKQHKGEPQGERIVVSGRALDENGKPIPGMLIEIWQANAAGRYNHVVDQHDAPIDPNFTGGGRCLTDANGNYRFLTIRPGEYPWRNHYNAWRPAHIHFSLFGPAIVTRLITQMYFPGDPLLDYDPMYNCVADEKARKRLVSLFDWENTLPEYALAYRFDLVLRGREATPMENRR